MQPLEELFRLEVEFHRRLRIDARGAGDRSGVHTSYALQAGYEQLLRSIGPVTSADIERLKHELEAGADRRDVAAAGDSLQQFIGIRAAMG